MFGLLLYVGGDASQTERFRYLPCACHCQSELVFCGPPLMLLSPLWALRRFVLNQRMGERLVTSCYSEACTCVLPGSVSACSHLCVSECAARGSIAVPIRKNVPRALWCLCVHLLRGRSAACVSKVGRPVGSGTFVLLVLSPSAHCVVVIVF